MEKNYKPPNYSHKLFIGFPKRNFFEDALRISKILITNPFPKGKIKKFLLSHTTIFKKNAKCYFQ